MNGPAESVRAGFVRKIARTVRMLLAESGGFVRRVSHPLHIAEARHRNRPQRFPSAFL